MPQDLYVIAVITAKPEKADELRTVLASALDAFRAEEGCKGYVLHEDEKRPGRFITYETWRDHDALAAHMKAPALQAIRPHFKDVMAQEMTQYFLSTVPAG